MKGFTLIEVLGVLILLGLISIVVVPVVSNVIKENKNTLYDVQISNIKNGAIDFTSENIFGLNLDEGNKYAIKIGDLKKLGYLEQEIINPKTNKDFNNEEIILIENISGSLNYTVCIDVNCDLSNVTYYEE